MQKLTLQCENPNQSVEEVFKDFIRSRRCKNVSNYTIEYYNRCYKKFSDFYDVTLPCSTINLNVIQDFILTMKDDSNVNDITLNTNLRGIRTILYYAMDIHYNTDFKFCTIHFVPPSCFSYENMHLQKCLSFGVHITFDNGGFAGVVRA